MKNIIYATALAFSIWTCVEPFEPEVGEYESTLVVDGLFSNSDDPSRVRLSRSFGYDEVQARPITGAQVSIEDDLGNVSLLEERQEGLYETDPSQYSGQIGRAYRLLIRTPDGNRFESDWEVMKAAPAVGDIEYEFLEKPQDDPALKPIQGIQLYLNTGDAEKNTRYYRWEFVETYRYNLRAPPYIRAEFGQFPGRGDDRIIVLSAQEFAGFRCWKTVESTQILIATTDHLTEDVIDKFPIHFVSNETPRLARKYSMLVRQYAISKPHYEFLNTIKQINQTTGSLFDPIPNEVFGNIHSSDGKDIPVLGYFGVAGLSAKRIFVHREDLPLRLAIPVGPNCPVDTVPLDFRELYNKIRFGRKVLFDYDLNDFGQIVGYLVSEPPCTSCEALGATNQVPDFW